MITNQCPPKSYKAGLRQVSEAPSPLSGSNHRQKSRRKAKEKKIEKIFSKEKIGGKICACEKTVFWKSLRSYFVVT